MKACGPRAHTVIKQSAHLIARLRAARGQVSEPVHLYSACKPILFFFLISFQRNVNSNQC